MNEQTTELARELVKSPAFRWMPGMLAEYGCGIRQDRVLSICDGMGGTGCSLLFADGHMHLTPLKYPDLDDPATAGCLLALLEGVVRDDNIDMWFVKAVIGGGVGSDYGCDVEAVATRSDRGERDLDETSSVTSLGDALARTIIATGEAPK